jgi:N utilization substance protein B
MSLPPEKFREMLFQILYSHGFEPNDEKEMIPFMMQELKVSRRYVADAFTRMHQILAKETEIYKLMGEASTEYAVERISRVERTILLLAFFEMLYDSSVPPKVAIAEAIRLCRKFGTPESANFVNAVLDGVLKKHAPADTEQPIAQ